MIVAFFPALTWAWPGRFAMQSPVNTRSSVLDGTSKLQFHDRRLNGSFSGARPVGKYVLVSTGPSVTRSAQSTYKPKLASLKHMEPILVDALDISAVAGAT